MRDAFCGYHPAVNFLYFVGVLGIAMFLLHPVILGIGLLSAVCYHLVLFGGRKTLRTFFLFILPVMIIVALVNPLFNHYGVTTLLYLQDGNPVTLESMVYGLVSGLMLCEVILWFQCYTVVVTSDKFIWLFGRIIPALSLILSMCLRFVPCFQKRMQTIHGGQKCMGRSTENGTIIQKIKYGIKSFSILVTWSLENAVETADSMKARGYGLRGRSAFSIYRMTARDKRAAAVMAACMMVFFIGAASGCMGFLYNPKIVIQGLPLTMQGALTYLAYGVFCLMPVLLNIIENQRFKIQRSKISDASKREYRLWT